MSLTTRTLAARMSGRTAPSRRPGLRAALIRCELLESRQLMDAGLGNEGNPTQPASELGDPTSGLGADSALTIVSVSPAPGAAVETAPERISVRFNQAIDPLSVAQDLVIERRDEAGGYEAVYEEWELPACHLDANDPNLLLLDLGRVLTPGQYRVRFSDWSFLTTVDMRTVDPGEMASPVCEFVVREPSQGFGQTTDLGWAGAGEIVHEGRLDFQSNPLAVDFYKFHLGSGTKLWSVGIEAQAQRLGSSLNASMALFDAGGRLIACVYKGRDDAPADPYLFRGLTAGTYYLAISAVGNRPDLPGGYSLLQSDAGRLTANQAGGAYEIHLAAEPALATPVIGLDVEHADPRDPAPTAIRLQFARAIDTSGLLATGNASSLFLTDSSGRSWPLVIDSYNEQTATLTCIPTRRLEPGGYEVRLVSGTIVDLAGLEPYGLGLPAGVLATLRVVARDSAAAAGDLGVIYPDTWNAGGVELRAELSAGEFREFRLVSLQAGNAELRLSGEGSGARVEWTDSVTGRSQMIELEPGETVRLLDLSAGEVGIRLMAGDGAARLQVRIIRTLHAESVTLNGVGQGPALGLMGLAPVAVQFSPSAKNAGVPSANAVATTGPLETTATQSGPAFVPVVLGTGAVVVSSSTAPSGVVTQASGVLLTMGGQPAGLSGAGHESTASLYVTAATASLATAPSAGEGAQGAPASDAAWPTLAVAAAERLGEPGPEPERAGPWSQAPAPNGEVLAALPLAGWVDWLTRALPLSRLAANSAALTAEAPTDPLDELAALLDLRDEPPMSASVNAPREVRSLASFGPTLELSVLAVLVLQLRERLLRNLRSADRPRAPRRRILPVIPNRSGWPRG